MRNKSFINESFMPDVGFKNIQSWLALHTSCKENINYFTQLTPIFDAENLINNFLFTDELLQSLIRKENLFSPKLSDLSTMILSLEKTKSILEISEFEDIRTMIKYYFNQKELKLHL